MNSQLGQTRSSRQPTHLLHTPDSFVRTPMPGLVNGLAIVHASRALGADFLWFTAEIAAGGTLAASPSQRFVYMLEGETVLTSTGYEQPLLQGSYAFSPANLASTLQATTAARCVVLEKSYETLDCTPQLAPFAGQESDLPPQPLNGDAGIQIRSMLHAGFEADFAVNTMTYAARAALSQVEIHYMEHGLLMLSGSGTYRLGDATYQVEPGDFIWMAPYCPQWFQADSTGPAKYLIYKNFNRVPA